MQQAKIYPIDEVFGVSRDAPLNYVSRQEVDEKFISSLSRQKHIVVHGSSKQGKTSLRKHCLKEDDYALVSCVNKWTLSDLHSAILKTAGYEVKKSVEKTNSGGSKISASSKGKLNVPFLGGAEIAGGAEAVKATGEKQTFEPLVLEPNDANDIILALEKIGFNKFIVLEDFHYLPPETQRDFSFALKVFHENSKFCFIVVGVWREENRLIGYNGDLTERVLSVDADSWSSAELRQVINAGEALLNVSFDSQFVDELLKSCFDSVHIVQEVCRRACREKSVMQTQTEIKTIGDDLNVSTLINDVVKEQAGRYNSFLREFSDGFQETDLKMPKWIIYSILCAGGEQLEKGLRQRAISRIIKTKHPEGTALNNGNIAQILKVVASLQNKKSIRPLVIDYNTASNRLSVVDKGFLIWLASQDVGELLEDLDLPKELDCAEIFS